MASNGPPAGDNPVDIGAEAAAAAAAAAARPTAASGPPPDLTSDTPPDVLVGTTDADARGGFKAHLPFGGSSLSRPAIRETERTQPQATTQAKGPSAFRFTGFLESMSSDAEIKYRMDHKKRGYAVIFSHEEFDRKTMMPRRVGNEKDVENLQKHLRKMGFEIMIFRDLSVEELKKTVAMAAFGTDHSDSDCFLCVFLTHGDDGVIYGRDGTLPIQVFFDCFRGDKCASLVGKPKIFLLQACRGEKHEIGLEHANSLETDSAEDEPDGGLTVTDSGPQPTVPAGADFILCYSVTQGYYSHRDTAYGSWYVQALCQALDTYGNTLEFTHLLTLVTRIVSKRAVERCLQPQMIGKKQVPCFMSMLTKQLFFTPKVTKK